jgi:hypothetical protein
MNPRGRYLKISEKTSATRSTIIVPFSGISWFLDLFNYYVNSDDQDVFSKELQLDTRAFPSFFLCSRPYLFIYLFPFYPFSSSDYFFTFQVFYFDIGENRRGRFLKVLTLSSPSFLCFPLSFLSSINEKLLFYYIIIFYILVYPFHSLFTY